MKNRFAALAAFLAATLTTTAVLAHPAWQFGLKGGFNVSQFRGDQVGLWLSGPEFNVSGTLLDSETGFIGGGYARYQLGRRFALQLEALYSRKGGKGNVFGSADITGENNIVYRADISGELSVDVDYLEFPLIAAFTLPAADGVSFVPYAGISGGVLVQANAYLSGKAEVPLPDLSTRTVDFSQAYNVERAFSDYEGQFLLGASVEWNTKHGRFVIDGRYSLSLRTIDATEEKTVRNSVLSVMAGFAWGKGEEIE